jgi:Tfp pilus assembly protein PilF
VSAAFQRGDLAEASRLFREALKEAEAFGETDPRLATALTNLATVYDAQGKLDEAAELFQRALAIDEKNLGEDEPKVAIDLTNLANVYFNKKSMMKLSLSTKEP